MTIPPSKPQSKAARNERRKAVAALFNTLSVALMGGGAVPTDQHRAHTKSRALGRCSPGFCCFSVGAALCTWQTGGLTMDPLLYAILVLTAAGALVAVGGLISMWRNR